MNQPRRVASTSFPALLAALLLPWSGPTLAAPIPVDLSISGGIEVLGSSFADPGALFSDALARKSGGVESTAAYDHTGLSASLGPAAFTDFGDGVGFGAGSGDQALNEASIGAGFAPGEGLETAVDLDFRIEIENTSAADTWKVTFLAEYESLADARLASSASPDSRVENRFAIDEPAGPILLNHTISDNLAGNSFNGVPTGSSGGAMYQDGTEFNLEPVFFLFDLLLAPGEIIALDGAFSTQLRAFVNEEGTGAVAQSSFAGFVSVHDAEIVPASAVPEPATLALAMSGLVLVVRRRTSRGA